MKKLILLSSLCFIVVSVLLVFKSHENNIKVISQENLAVYLDNELQESIPRKGEAVISKIICDNDVNASWNNDTWSLEITDLSKKTKCNLYFISYSGDSIFNFDYTGGYQTFTVPVSGTYKVELWGAGVGAISNGAGVPLSYGSYVSGLIKMQENQKLYIYVGENGYAELSNPDKQTYRYNGGGYGNYVCYKYYLNYENNPNKGGSYSGGGATDIRLENGDWNNFDSLKSRIMVAAGSGGINTLDRYKPSNGGGLYSEDGGYYGDEKYKATGATQTSSGSANGKFGLGGFAIYGGDVCNISDGGGGGGGYYGGGGSNTGNNAFQASTGAGGSSFISGHNGCDAIKEESTEDNIIHTGQSIHYSNIYFTDTVMIDGSGYKWTTEKGDYTGMPSHDDDSIISGNAGNGYARITLISIDE